MVQCLKYNLNSFIDTSCFLEGEINKLNLLFSKNMTACWYTHILSLLLNPYQLFIYYAIFEIYL